MTGCHAGEPPAEERGARTLSVAVIPGAPGLLPEHAGQVDPLAEVRAAVSDALAGLAGSAAGGLGLLARPGWGTAVGHHLAVASGLPDPAPVEAVPGTVLPPALVVVADGSARRGEKAPGHLDERAAAYDASVEAAVAAADLPVLAALDLALGEELLAAGAPVLAALAAALLADGARVQAAELCWAGDPYGVRYWVARWELLLP